MSMYTFKLPDIGEGIAEAEIALWKVAVGDVVVEDQPLCDMLTDKAAVELTSPVAGTVTELRGAAGESVAVGGALVLIETQAERAAPAETEKQASGKIVPTIVEQKATPAPAPSAQSKQLANDHPAAKPLASPAVRRRAREMGVDLVDLMKADPQHRINHADLDAWESSASKSSVAGSNAVEDIPIIGMRRKIAAAMQHANQTIAHFSYVEEVDVTELEALREHLNQQREAAQAKLSMLPFLVQALIRCVPQYPLMNARYDDQAQILHRYDALHVGIAAQTPQGLLVPVVHNAQRLDIWACAAQIQQLAEAARTGRATREQLSGSSITISSLGRMGGIVSTPIINSPEVAIIGVNKIAERAVFQNGVVVPRLIMNLSSSFDHRIVDGWDAASFIQAIKARLEFPATLFLD